MNGVVARTLVIGGGFSGMTAAIQLARAGVAVDLVEIDAGWRSYGAGISLNGATLRLMKQIGLLPKFLEAGYATDGVDMRGPGDVVLVTMPTPRVAGPDVPGGGAIMRPALARILSEEVRTAGVDVRLGQTFLAIEDGAAGCGVRFLDGSAATYDLVIAADGLYSTVRGDLFPDAPKPRFIGQSVWRAVLPRPPEIHTTTMWMGPKLKAGMNLVTADQVYLFLTEDRPTNDLVAPATFLPALKELLARFQSPILQAAREQLSEASQIVYRPLEQLLLPRPWHRGRVVLIGDAAHATTPHLAAGACLGMEDAVVLAEEIASAETLDQALTAFGERRWERCRTIVENSGRLGEIEVTGGSREEHTQIMQATMRMLAQAI